MKNEIVKGKMQEIARKVKEELPENWGFVVLAFEFGDGNDTGKYGRRENK